MDKEQLEYEEKLKKMAAKAGVEYIPDSGMLELTPDKPKWQPQQTGTFRETTTMPVYYQDLLLINKMYGSRFTFHSAIKLNNMFKPLVTKFELLNKCYSNLRTIQNPTYKDITSHYHNILSHKEKRYLEIHFKKNSLKIALPIEIKEIKDKIITPFKMSNIELYENLPHENFKKIYLIEIVKEQKSQYRICL